MPTDSPREKEQVFRERSRSWSLSTELTQALERMRSEHNVSLSCLLLSGLNTLLYRYSNTEDITVAVARWHTSGGEEIWPIRTEVKADLSFADLLKDIEQTLQEFQRHDGLSLEQLIQQSQIDGTGADNSALQILYEPLESFQASERRGSHLKIENTPIKAEIRLQVRQTHNNLRGLIVYNAELFEEGTIERIVGSWEKLLKGITESPTKVLGEFDVLSAQEEMIRKKWNETGADFPQQCLHELFEAQMEKTPNAWAISFRQDRWSYQQLNERANQVAYALELQGIQVESPIGVYAERSVQTVIGLLGILKAGGVYLPLDLTYPQDYIDFILEETNAPVLLVEKRFAGRLPKDYRGKILYFEEIVEAYSGKKLPKLPDKMCTPDDLATIVYTSGSTGRPKGVEQSHRYHVERLAWNWMAFPFEDSDVMSQRTTVNFVVSLWEFLGGLLAGVPTVILPDEVCADPQLLAQTLHFERVTRLLVVPSLLRTILDLKDVEKYLSGVRWWVSLGEPLPVKVFESLVERLPQARLINQYGSTEVYDVCYYDTQTQNNDVWRRRGTRNLPVGHPLTNTKIHILNEYMNAVPIGTAGDLYIDSLGMAKGYLKREAETRQRFLVNPFEDKYSDRLYKIGDVGRYLPDGSIEILGRKDHQVKVRGIRIELAGIEAALTEMDGLEEVAVIARERRSGLKQLIAYVVMKEGQEQKRKKIRAALAERLPSYMVPSLFVPLQKLPHTPNGKVDRLALENAGTELEMQAEKDGGERLTLNQAKRFLRQTAARIFGISVSNIEDSAPFLEIGGDSLALVELLLAVEEEYGLELGVAVLFNHVSVEDLARYLVDQHVFAWKDNSGSPGGLTRAEGPEDSVIDIEEERLVDRKQDRSLNVAIIGISGRFPGADSVEKLWEMLKGSRDAIREVPLDRWAIDEYYDTDPQKPNKTTSKWGGMLQDVDCFDPNFFSISPREAELMDPQQRLFLSESWKALEDAGYADTALTKMRVGVFVGVRSGDYLDRIKAQGIAPDAYTLMGNDSAILAARISYFLNLRGPSIAIDTACSSSLVAVHLACQSIKNGESEIALAGGVNVRTTAGPYITDSKIGMSSPDGKCKTFDQEANGIVPGEAVGVIVLKGLDQAISDGDQIYGVIKGTGTNHNGKTNGITAPSMQAQVELEHRVYHQYGIDPARITYVEAHGTGTRLGDPIEVEALTLAFREFTQRTQFCAIGSVKTNVGHTIAAAGIVGLVKILLSMKYKQIPASLHCNQENEHIDFANSPFYVNKELTAWTSADGMPRQAAISSFGYSGTNCHVVVEEAPHLARHEENVTPYYLVSLSAKTAAALQRKIHDLIQWCEANRTQGQDLRAISYTLNTGRSHFSWRCAFIADSIEELYAALRNVVDGFKADNFLMGEVNEEKTERSYLVEVASRYLLDEIENLEGLDASSYMRRLFALGELYILGYDINWASLYSARKPRKISLPSYPFENEHFWIVQRKQSPTWHASEIAKTLHPLVHENCSTLDEQIYQSLFTGNEFFFRGHVVNGQKVLPGVAYLEMARTAGELALRGKRVLGFRNVDWIRVIRVNRAPVEVTVRLYREGEALVYQVATKDESQVRIHAQGEVIYEDTSFVQQLAPFDIGAIRNRCSQRTSKEALYQLLTGRGLTYDSNFQSVEEVWSNDSEALARLRRPADGGAIDSAYDLHPGLMDGALHSVGVLEIQSAPEQLLYIPSRVDEIYLYAALPDHCYAYAVRDLVIDGDHSAIREEKSNFKKYTIHILNDNGEGLVTLKGLSFRPYQKVALAPPSFRSLHLESYETARDNISGLREKTEGYLTELLSRTLQMPADKIKSDVPFRSLGVDSIMTIDLILELEERFGDLSMMLFSECDNIRELSSYLIEDHEEVLIQLFEHEDSLHQDNPAGTGPREQELERIASLESSTSRIEDHLLHDNTPLAPMFIRKTELLKFPKEQRLIEEISRGYEAESGYTLEVSMPYIFFDSRRQGFYRADHKHNNILAFSYVGPREHKGVVTAEMLDFCLKHSYHLNLNSDTPVQTIGDLAFTATPFLVMQHIHDLPSFNLDGGRMRRLRYLVTKFERMGTCHTDEYQIGSNEKVDQAIVQVIDEWVFHKKMRRPVGSAVERAREDIVSAHFDNQTHRLFLTYLNDLIQNVVIISEAPLINGFFLDLEFYPKSMSLGALEFAICKIIEIIAAEGCTSFSLGGTPNISITVPSNVDHQMANQLKRIHDNGILNDDGNFQFKNKFCPTNTQFYLIRPGEAPSWDIMECLSMIWPSSRTIAGKKSHIGKAETNSSEDDLPREIQSQTAITPAYRLQDNTTGIEALNGEIFLCDANGRFASQPMVDYWQSFCQNQLLEVRFRQKVFEYLSLLPTVDFGGYPEHIIVETASQARIEVLRWGDNGKPILMIPGFGVTAPVYSRQVSEWQHQFQVMVIHVPGVGLSEPANDFSFRLEDVSDLLMEVLKHLKICSPLHIVGSSWGGLVAQVFAARFNEAVSSLILIQSTDNISPASFRKETPVRDEIRENFYALGKTAISQKEKGGYEADYQLLLKSVAFDPRIHEYLQEQNLSTTNILEKIAAPTLVITGELDIMIGSERSETLRLRIPNARHEEIGGARHFAELTHHEQVNEKIMQFIQEHDGGIDPTPKCT